MKEAILNMIKARADRRRSEAAEINTHGGVSGEMRTLQRIATDLDQLAAEIAAKVPDAIAVYPADKYRVVPQPKPVDYADLARRCRAAARECIARARKAEPGAHFTHRGIELLPLDASGERAGDGGAIEYFEVDKISGKQIRQALANHSYDDMVSFTLCGGIDWHESFQIAMQYPDDYEPMYSMWDVEPGKADEIDGAAA